MRTVKACDIRCPECGKGFADVAPTYELSLDGVFASYESSTIYGHCEEGHGFFAELNQTGLLVEVSKERST